MIPSPRLRGVAAPVSVVAILFAVAACGPSGASQPTGSANVPAASQSAACPTAPSVPDNLPGWAAPATPPPVVPYIIASPGELVCGKNRIMFTILDTSGTPIGAPDRSFKVAFYDLGRDPNTAISTADGTFVWAIENERGDYIVNTSFPDAGTYGAEVATSASGGAPTTLRMTFDVQPTSPVIKVGDKAPASQTPTLADVGGDVSKISSDTTPDPAFYQTSVDQAIAAHKPFLLVFATPKFCVSAQCGPTLDRIKPFVTKYPTVTFINVEPYQLTYANGSLQPVLDEQGQLQTVAATDQWHLFSEPNVFVVNKDGIVTANFELIFSDAELTTALDAVK